MFKNVYEKHSSKMMVHQNTNKLSMQLIYEQKKSFDMNHVAAIILGGGQGTRLFPLTQTRCKPAISIGGRYRLIDIPLSNAINSKISKLSVVTQFLSGSLHRHILRTYRTDRLSRSHIDLLVAEQRPESCHWYAGTADAIRKNIDYFHEVNADYFLILSGDQLYHYDFQPLIDFAIQKDADLVLSCIAVNEADAKRMGVLKLKKNSQISHFFEKPNAPSILKKFQNTAHLGAEKPFLASMGIYVFKKKVLIDLLQQDTREDFGKHLIPTQIAKGKSFGYVFDGYWEDIGTVESYFKANLELTVPHSKFHFLNEQFPIYSFPQNLPGAQIFNSCIDQSILCEGSIIDQAKLQRCVIGTRSKISKGSILENCIMFGNDFYQRPTSNTAQLPDLFEIGENCHLKNVILDKHVHIGKNVKFTNSQNLSHYDGKGFYVRDGITIVTKGSCIPDNFEF